MIKLKCRHKKKAGRFIKQILLLFIKALSVKLAYLLTEYLISVLKN